MRYLSQETIQNMIGFINDYYVKNGYSPTIAEISRGLSLAVGTIHKYLHRMEEMDMLSFDGRHIITPYIEELQSHFTAPISGDIACGSPIYAEEQHDGSFPIPTQFIGKGEFFWLRTKGDSMINLGINNGDLVLIRKQNYASEGDVVVALIEDSATLKTYTLDKKNKEVILIAENDDKENYPNQIYNGILIQGVAVSVLKKIKRRMNG